jgi:hypothetical protein
MHQSAKNGDHDGEVIDSNTVVSARELGDVLALSEAHVYNLKRKGVFQSTKADHKRNEFLLGPSVQAYIQYKCSRDSPSEADFHRERALKEKANRELREILLEQNRGQLHRSSDVSSIITHNNGQIRDRLLEFSNALAPQLVGKEPGEIKTLIDTEVRKVLVGLTRYDAKDYYRWLAHSSAK